MGVDSRLQQQWPRVERILNNRDELRTKSFMFLNLKISLSKRNTTDPGGCKFSFHGFVLTAKTFTLIELHVNA